MMKNMTLAAMTAACKGTLCQPDPSAGGQETAAGVCVDSRLVEPGFVFVATKGERVDGHSYIASAFEKGAMAVICEVLPDPLWGPCILVSDSFEALRLLAGWYRRQFDIPVVGITGSVGKTSTKEFIASVLAQRFSTLKTEGNFNNEVGLPLTIFRMEERHEIAVLEMGINTFGEMTRLSEIARPDHVVMTNIGECHLEFLGDRDGVLRAKSEIFQFMNPEGTVFINADDDKLVTIRSVHGKVPVRFGFSSSYEFWAELVKDEGLSGCSALIHTPEGSFPVHVNLPGRHMLVNAVAAAAVGLQFGLSFEQIRKGIESVLPVDGRSHLIRTSSLTIIDDCYNANPVSTKAALDLLASAGSRTVAILGDMFELGEDELAMHEDVGRYAAEKGIDVLLCAGALSSAMDKGAKAAAAMLRKDQDAGEAGGVMECLYFPTRKELLDGLAAHVRSGDTVLVKASHGMAYAEVVEQLKKHFS